MKLFKYFAVALVVTFSVQQDVQAANTVTSLLKKTGLKGSSTSDYLARLAAAARLKEVLAEISALDATVRQGEKDAAAFAASLEANLRAALKDNEDEVQKLKDDILKQFDQDKAVLDERIAERNQTVKDLNEIRAAKEKATGMLKTMAGWAPTMWLKRGARWAAGYTQEAGRSIEDQVADRRKSITALKEQLAVLTAARETAFTDPAFVSAMQNLKAEADEINEALGKIVAATQRWREANVMAENVEKADQLLGEMGILIKGMSCKGIKDNDQARVPAIDACMTDMLKKASKATTQRKKSLRTKAYMPSMTCRGLSKDSKPKDFTDCLEFYRAEMGLKG